MNRDEHIIIGFFIGLLGGVFGSGYTEYFNFILYTLYVGLTVFGSILPNLIEPRNSQTHRKFFHSYLVVFILVILLVWINSGDQSMLTYLSTSFLVGYLAHLLLDATSKVGLPKY